MTRKEKMQVYIGAQLRNGRQKLKMSQEETEKYTGISKNMIQRIETGKRDTGITQLIALCGLYNINPINIIIDADNIMYNSAEQ